MSYYKRSSASSALARIAVCDTLLCAAALLRSGGSARYREQLSSITVGNDGMPMAALGAATTSCEVGGGT